MSIDEALLLGVDELKDAVARPRYESELILSSVLECDRTYLHTHGKRDIAKKRFIELLKRRKAREPLEYILQKVSFYSEELFIKRGALIPRPESELLVDRALEIINQHSIKKVCEVGVGSGAISCMLALKSEAEVVAVDISSNAVEIASVNIKRFGLEDRVKLKRSDILQGVDGYFELIVSNPPYVSNSYKVEKELEYEPREALYGGEVGDEFIKRMLLEVRDRCRFLLCEIGYDQREALLSFILSNSLGRVHFFKDYANLDRLFLLEFNS